MRNAIKYGAIDGRTDYFTVCHRFVDEDTSVGRGSWNTQYCMRCDM